MLADRIAYETFLGYDEVKEQILEKQGEVDVLEAFELYQYKVSFKQFIPLNTISIRSKTVTRLLWVNSIFLAYFLATGRSAGSGD